MSFLCIQAANYLNIKSLLDLGCLTVANMIKGESSCFFKLLSACKTDCSLATSLMLNKADYTYEMVAEATSQHIRVNVLSKLPVHHVLVT